MGRVLSDYQENAAHSGPSSNFFFMANKIKVSSRTQKRFRNFPRKTSVWGCQPSFFWVVFFYRRLQPKKTPRGLRDRNSEAPTGDPKTLEGEGEASPLFELELGEWRW